MNRPMDTPFSVFHVMRTYGNHGGERQLAQMFAQPLRGITEHFAFLYHDPACRQLFSHAAGAGLRFHCLWPFAVRPRHSAWGEMAVLSPLLPWMQIRLLILLLCYRPKACIVHGFQAALVAWPAAMLLGRHIGFAYFHRTTKSSAGRHRLFRLIYAPYRKLLGVSQAVRTSLGGLAEGERLAVLENGVNVKEIQQATGMVDRHASPALITVGRLMPQKGQRLIIEAFTACRDEFPHLELWIAGDGEYRAELEAFVAARDIKGVKFLGRREDIPALLAAATVFCNASEWEGLSNAVLEAMAAALPSIVVDAPGVTECHIAGTTGFVIERDAGAFAEKLRLLLRDAELRQRMGQAALQRVQSTYSIETNREKYRNLYCRLAGVAECAE